MCEWFRDSPADENGGDKHDDDDTEMGGDTSQKGALDVPSLARVPEQDGAPDHKAQDRGP